MGFVTDALGLTSDYRADEGYLDQPTLQSAGNNMQLQQMLMDQAQGKGPNLADQMNRLAVQRNQAAAASLLGGMKGISPAAMTRAVTNAQTQAGAEAAGQATLARMQQQMEAQRLLGVNSLGMTGIGANYKQGAQGINAGVEQANTAAMGKVIGGVASGLAGGAAMGAMANGGEVPPANGPQSWLGQAALEMRGGGMVPGRAAVPGDAAANDTVRAMLSPGEVVLPRTVAQGGPQAAYDFVAALRARGGR